MSAAYCHKHGSRAMLTRDRPLCAKSYQFQKPSKSEDRRKSNTHEYESSSIWMSFAVFHSDLCCPGGKPLDLLKAIVVHVRVVRFAGCERQGPRGEIVLNQ
jgi:hypothetical protein